MSGRGLETQRLEILHIPNTETIQHINHGIELISLALAFNVRERRMRTNALLVNLLFEEMILGARQAIAGSISRVIDPGRGHLSGLEYAFGSTDQIQDYLRSKFSAALYAAAEITERMASAKVYTVAGHQGSGKDALAPLFTAHGYQRVTLSDIVRDIVSALGRDRNDAQTKINVGLFMKAFMGSDVLVKLGIAEAVMQGKNQLVMFGPRLPAEVKGALIGVIADREIRKARIIARAQQDPSRAGDVADFERREEQEQADIEGILTRPNCIRIVNESQIEDFYSLAEKVIFAQANNN